MEALHIKTTFPPGNFFYFAFKQKTRILLFYTVIFCIVTVVTLYPAILSHWILIHEPARMFLFGAGLVGMAGFARNVFKKQSG